jgi:hypothetical protein
MSFGIPLGPYTIDLEGLNPLTLDIPNDYTVSLGGTPNNPIDISGIPNDYTVSIGGTPDHPITVDLGAIEIKPMDFSIRLKEIPSIRAHLPLNYQVCFALFGFELVKVNLCGEGQVITEPYVPNPCECGYAPQPAVITPPAVTPPREPS